MTTEQPRRPPDDTYIVASEDSDIDVLVAALTDNIDQIVFASSMPLSGHNRYRIDMWTEGVEYDD